MRTVSDSVDSMGLVIQPSLHAMSSGSLLALASKSMTTKKRCKKETSWQATMQKEDNSYRMEDIEKVVDRNIGRHFGSMPAAAIDVVLVDGVTLRQTMVNDRVELLNRGRARADCEYFCRLKKQYMAALSGNEIVLVTDSYEKLHEGLAVAMSAARAKNRRDRKRTPMIHWLKSRQDEINQKSLLGIIDLLVETQLCSCVKQAHLVVEVFFALHRLGQLEASANELAIMKPTLEESLITLYREENMKDEDYEISTFWKRYRLVASMFLDKDLVDKLVAEQHSWSNVTYELSILATGSKLGLELFLRFCPEAVSAHVSSFMKAKAKEFAESNKLVNAVNLAELTQLMVTEACRLSMDKLVATGSNYEFEFMGFSFAIRAHTSLEVARFHDASMVKTLAVHAGRLAQLTIEKEIRGAVQAPASEREWDDAALESYCEARTLMDSLMKKAEFTSASKVAEFMESKRSLWFRSDPTFVLEVAYMKTMAGKQGGEFLVEQATKMLPDGSKIVDVGKVLLQMRTLAGSMAWIFAGPSAKNVVNSIIDILGNMERGEGPVGAQFPKGTAMEQVSERLAFFCHAEVEHTKSLAEKKTIFGLEALIVRIESIKTDMAAGSLKELGPVTICQLFRWLLPSDKAAELDKISREAYEKVVLAAAPTDVDKAKGGNAMEHMVAAHKSMASGKAIKKAADAVATKIPKANKAKHA